MSSGVVKDNRVICRFNLRGMCRFGSRCRNIHQKPEKLTEWMENKVPSSENMPSDSSQGACALSPKKSKELKVIDREKISVFGPSTSSIEEAITLVKKAESADKSCGICFDIVLQKINKIDQVFGILPNCNHCFCFGCIKKWRQSKEFDLDVAKACPECRVASEFVYPSKYWIDTKEEKDEFIDSQKQRMKKMDCRYFRKGKGKCPFGNTCLYLHALPNGKILDVGPPSPRRRSRGSGNQLVDQILFWLHDDFDDDGFDLDDPYIAMQYYDHGEIERYIAMDRLMNSYDDDDEDDDYDIFVLA